MSTPFGPSDSPFDGSPEGFAEQGVTEFLLTVDDLETMLRAGVFDRDDATRVELEDGRLVRMSSESLHHARAAARLSLALNLALTRLDMADRFEVLNGGTVRVSDFSAFDPDGAVIARDAEAFFLRPDQVLLVIESSLATLKRDLGSKSHAYAAAGIAEYWVIDIKHTQLHVFRRPVAGDWTERLILTAADSVSPLFATDADIALTSVF
ncbi:Uma2 family endonuclease [Caulobacter hibisci]|uniref:Uma2 family endonuclease n=1 Tax=Caulobacter hibisci TaxID=2035993 RepID=A0ABS0SYC8_9CAUL|nr:Uma2 family endonuclease [Caulobacter hibisci]MBI1683895.1 Uma2 family endonuclease [Caulobacter hibisci]